MSLDNIGYEGVIGSTWRSEELSRSSDSLSSTLRLLIPPTALDGLFAGSSSSLFTARDFIWPYFKVLIFLVANNFPGLDEERLQAILKPLHERPQKEIQTLFKSLAYPIRVTLAENLFYHAIKGGDLQMVEALLQNPALGIDVNNVTALTKNTNTCHNPLVLSIRYDQSAVFKVLLKYSAAIDKADSVACDRSNRYHGILGLMVEKYPNAGLELLGLVVEAGARVDKNHLLVLCYYKCFDQLAVIMRKWSQQDYYDWYMKGVIHQYVWLADHDRSARIIDLVSATRISPSIESSVSGGLGGLFEDKMTILDILARKGDLDLLRKLHQVGVNLTNNVMINAVKSEKMDLCQYLIGHGANIDVVSSGSTPFAEAIRIRNPQLIQILIQRGALHQISEGERFQAAMIAASATGHLDVLAVLLKLPAQDLMRKADALRHGLETSLEASQNDSALLLIRTGMKLTQKDFANALSRGNVSIARALLDAGLKLKISAGKGTKLLSRAITLGDQFLIKELISQGAAVDIPHRKYGSPLFAAIKKRDKKLVKLLLDAGSGPNLHCETYGTGSILTEAVDSRDIEMVRLLLAYGANCDASVALGTSILNGTKDIADLLIQEFSAQYPNGVEDYGSLALMIAATFEDSYWIERIIDEVDINGFCNGWGSQHIEGLFHEWDMLVFDLVTPLGGIIWRNQRDSTIRARFLLERGANPNAVSHHESLHPMEPWYIDFTQTKSTALMLAMSNGNIPMIELLLQFNADINQLSDESDGQTPLQHAVAEGDFGMVQFLLSKGAKANDQPARMRGATALQLAAIGGYIGIASLLIDNGADVNAPPSLIYGSSALQGAAEWGRLDMVKFLLNSGFDIKSDLGRQDLEAAMDLAEANGHEMAVDLIKSYCSNLEPPLQPVFTDFEDFEDLIPWGMESEEEIEACEGEVPMMQTSQGSFKDGPAPIDVENLGPSDTWLSLGDLFGNEE